MRLRRIPEGHRGPRAARNMSRLVARPNRWTPRMWSHPPIDAFEQIAEPCCCDRDHTVYAGPDEAATFQSLCEQAHALTVRLPNLDEPAATIDVSTTTVLSLHK